MMGMSNSNVTEMGDLDSWAEAGKRFVEKEIGAEFMGVSINSTEPGGESPFWHRHSALEEVYIVIDGQGEFALGDEVLPLAPGTIVRAGRDAWHALRCLPDSGAPMRWICVRAGGDTLAGVGKDAELDRDRPFPWNA
ncbi:hypothetical protein FM104_14730 [Microbacterium esteraromaticum]|uniref:Cupin type-2 domain-containing protein n=2 Tax=Microbacterium esteraromaticum TaxID=57043 RepID=A0A1R4KPP4_9MICO|nr:hypothetical protein FM104_14730 [Microbacterium esteraromaticum]